MTRRRDPLLGQRRADRLHPPRLPAAAPPPHPLPPARRPTSEIDPLPKVSLIIAAHDEEDVIAAKVENALAPRLPARAARGDRRLRRLRRRDRRAGARGRRRPRPRAPARRQDRRPERRRRAGRRARSSPSPTPTASGRPDALRSLVEPFADPAVGYVCGQVRFLAPEGDNLEGAYWRYEMEVREMESQLAGVTAGNGAIYAVRRDAYVALPPSGSHDLSLPVPARQARPALALRRRGAPPRRRWCRRSRASSPANGG